MQRRDVAAVIALALLAAFIWLRDLRWLDAAGDTLPILVGLPLFIWLASPWHAAPTRFAARSISPALVLGVVAFAVGIVADSTLVLAAAWTFLLWSWMSRRVAGANNAATRKLLVLPFISFPWIANDFERLGWWFRLSGAAAVARALGAFDFEVVRRGTFLVVNGFSVSVEPACSGLNGLQAMLVAGVVLAYVKLKHTPWFWWNLPLLVAAAWFANFARIAFGAVFGATLDPAFAQRWIGPVHEIGGWVALCAMFLLCWLLFSWEERATRTNRSAGRRLAALPWLEFAVVGYCAWRSREIFGAWFTAPFARFGWLAFAIWIMPLALRPLPAHRSGLGHGARRPWIAAAGVALTLLGDLGDLNLCHHLGLALVLIAFAPRAGRALWGVSAIAWLPALGWLASRIGMSPAALAGLRVGIAALGGAWAWSARSARELDYADGHEVTL
ncbi:MAG TPA: archaeosortase/exosortase family protein [Opitutaceae bacterium]|nr:archaeosortase/exosortase family protein [Opitutaceae bacterium]